MLVVLVLLVLLLVLLQARPQASRRHNMVVPSSRHVRQLHV
jgi:hypothetical protein